MGIFQVKLTLVPEKGAAREPGLSLALLAL